LNAVKTHTQDFNRNLLISSRALPRNSFLGLLTNNTLKKLIISKFFIRAQNIKTEKLDIIAKIMFWLVFCHCHCYCHC